MFLFCAFCVLLVAVATNAEPLTPVAEETYADKLIRLAYAIEDDPQLKAEYEQRYRDSKDLVLPPIQFTCIPEFSSEVPTSAHAVRPSDIKVLGAFGDSISAGNGLGADTAPGVAIENRGEVFTIGGDYSLDAGVITLTNFFRKFNPAVMGYSICASTRDNLKKSWLNVAEPGGDNRDMPPQAVRIIDRLQNDERIDFDNDWKMISLFVGGNDLCASCRRTEFSPESYGAKFREAVDLLYDQVPRLIVNLIVMFDVTPLPDLSTGVLCDLLQINFCDCAVNVTTRAQLRTTQMEYYDQLKTIADDEKYYGREDFAVVLQPHMRDQVPPIDPETGDYLPGFLAPDCFHPNRVAHQYFAYDLWNTLFVPVGQKLFAYDFPPIDSEDPIVASCPTPDHPYIFTNLNSDVDWP